MKRIAFFQYDLSVGGIQRSLVNLLRNIDYSRYEVDLYLFSKNDFWDISFPPELHVKYLQPLPKAWSLLPFEWSKRAMKLDFASCQPYDLAIDFNSYQQPCAIGAVTVPAKKRAMWIHNDVELKLKDEWKYRVLWNAFRGKFKYFDTFVGVSPTLIDPFRRMSRVTRGEFLAIPNFIDTAEIYRRMEEEPVDFRVNPECMNFVAVGHLNHQKAYDIMVDVFAKACKVRPDLHLYILGDGPQREALEKQIASLGMGDAITLLGYQTNPFCYMKKMDAFLSTSRYEGQPLNIMEAIAVGLPLYCTKNLEKYCTVLEGKEDIVQALIHAQKEEKHPDDLAGYNQSIVDAVYAMVP